MKTKLIYCKLAYWLCLDVFFVTVQCGSRVMVGEPQYGKSDFPFVIVVDESCVTKRVIDTTRHLARFFFDSVRQPRIQF
jgi:hypothetical protein